MRYILPLGLIALIFISALGVVGSRHQSRKLFAELQALEQERDKMNDEWSRLLLEQATWGTHGRIEELAHNRLDMRVPSNKEIIQVRQ